MTEIHFWAKKSRLIGSFRNLRQFLTKVGQKLGQSTILEKRCFWIVCCCLAVSVGGQWLWRNWSSFGIRFQFESRPCWLETITARWQHWPSKKFKPASGDGSPFISVTLIHPTDGFKPVTPSSEAPKWPLCCERHTLRQSALLLDTDYGGPWFESRLKKVG